MLSLDQVQITRGIQMRLKIQLKPQTFHNFKQAVSAAFPAWQVNSFKPFIYISEQADVATLFSLSDYDFSDAELNQLSEIVATVKPSQALLWQPTFAENPKRLNKKLNALASRIKF